MTFWYGSGSADPYLWLTDSDPEPAISFFVYYFLKLHLHNFSQMKSLKEQEVWRFFLNIFAWWLKEPDLVLADKDPDPGGPTLIPNTAV